MCCAVHSYGLSHLSSSSSCSFDDIPYPGVIDISPWNEHVPRRVLSSPPLHLYKDVSVAVSVYVWVQCALIFRASNSLISRVHLLYFLLFLRNANRDVYIYEHTVVVYTPQCVYKYTKKYRDRRCFSRVQSAVIKRRLIVSFSCELHSWERRCAGDILCDPVLSNADF